MIVVVPNPQGGREDWGPLSTLQGKGPPPASGQPEGRPCAAELTLSESPQQQNGIQFSRAANTSIGGAELVFPYPPDPT